MSGSNASEQPRVVVASDASTALVEISPSCPSAEVGPEILQKLAVAAGVELDERSKARLRQLAEEFHKNPKRIREVFAQAVPPKPPQDATIKWQQGLDPTQASEESGAQAPAGQAPEKVDHYTCSHFVNVKAGRALGLVVPGKRGTPGRDVLGMTIEPKQPTDITDRIDTETINVDGAGRLSAICTGALTLRERDNVFLVDDVVTISTDVDFSVGNIELESSLRVTGGVKDLFKVKAAKNVEILGLVEQASISCGGNLTLKSGMAGRQGGLLDIGEDVTARYLNGVKARIGATLHLAREMVSCDVIIGAELDGEAASIIGGKTVIAGAARVRAVGSPSETPTTIVLGTVVDADAGDGKAPKAKVSQKELETEANRLRDMPKPSSADRERLMELEFELGQLPKRGDASSKSKAAGEAAPFGAPTVDFTVNGRLCPNVTFIIDGKTLVVREQIKGPVTIKRESSGEIVAMRAGGKSVPFNSMLGGTPGKRAA